jgi:hypothetical protein
VARKPNYNFEKRQRETEKAAKKEAKAQRKRDQAAGLIPPDEVNLSDYGLVPDAGDDASDDAAQK